MGRKIPAKKHRGVKDPLEQQARRLQSLKSKINAPPTDPDDQPVPRSLERLFGFQQRNKDNNKKNVKRTHSKDSSVSGLGGNPISRLRKLPGESGRGFSLRINSAVRALTGGAGGAGGVGGHYPLDVEDEEDARGARMADLRERRARKGRRAAGRGVPPAAGRGVAPDARRGGPPAGAARVRKLALKKQAKKEKADEAAATQRELVYERVPFGAVSAAPPVLRPPRSAPAAAAGASRPGRRDLLLSKLLVGGAGGAATGVGARGASGAAAGARRQAAVDAYRALKANKNKNNRPA